MSASEGTRDVKRRKIAEDLQKNSLDFSKDIMKIFNDPIHGKIELHPLLVKIIDTPQFQRLRHLKQLGALSLVYPGGTHTRFEHSLGVAYLAGCLVKTLDINQPELNITPGDMLCVQIAGLCHNLGHGPLSHLFDGKFIPSTRPGYQWKHEKGSIDLFRNLVEDNGLREEMENYGLNPGEDVRFIEELIMGVEASVATWPENRARPENKSFLYEIVANKQNGVDVDKWDYLARDAYHLGIQNSFDYQCLLKSARVCEVEIGQRNVQSVRITEKVCELGGEARKQHFPLKDNRVCEIKLEKKNVRRLTICFRDKVADDIYDMFYTRYTLHRQALQHKVGFVIDDRMKDVLVEADGHLQISAAIDNMAKYTRLTDDIFEEIRHSSEPGLNGAKAILDKTAHRLLPKFVGEARLKESRREAENHVNDSWRDMCRDNNLNNFKIHVLDMGFGIVGGNLLGNVYFYNKRDPNTAFRIQSYQVSSLKPVKFHERLVRVYCTDMDQRDAERHFREWCRINRHIIDYHEPVSNNDNPEPEMILKIKVFNDPIHGQIELPRLLVKIIDTPQFQRLRHIKQLGGAYLVYPGATHTRFEHSIGMAYLAGRLVSVLQKEQLDLRITREDRLCVQIAALCYNLGHGPFSHLFEDKFMPIANNVQWRHEDASVQMLRYIVNNNGLREEMRRNQLNPDEDLPFIEELIMGVQASESQHEERSTNKPFLYEIVVNQSNGVDVRKWDYLARDCHTLGIPNNFDYERLLEFVRVCDVNREQHICFRDKVADNVYDMFHTRYTLHRKAYKHKICYIIEEKIAEALGAARGFPDLLVNVENLNIETYSKLTDHIFNKILHSPEPTLSKARGILEDIVHRRLPKFVGEARLKEDDRWNENDVRDSWRDMCRNNNLTAHHFQIHFLNMGFGNEGEQLLDNVYFYNKRDPNTAFRIQSYQVSSLKPVKFHEKLVRVYCTDMDQRVQRKAERHFHKWCTDNRDTFIDFGPVLDDDDSGEGAH